MAVPAAKARRGSALGAVRQGARLLRVPSSSQRCQRAQAFQLLVKRDCARNGARRVRAREIPKVFGLDQHQHSLMPYAEKWERLHAAPRLCERGFNHGGPRTHLPDLWDLARPHPHGGQPQATMPPAGQAGGITRSKGLLPKGSPRTPRRSRKRASGEAPGQIVAQDCGKIPAEKPQSLQPRIN